MLSFLRNLRRLKTAYLLNIIGLSVAFAAFIIIMIQVRHEFGFDRSTPHHDVIFRAEQRFVEENPFTSVDDITPIFSENVANELFASSPLIESGCIIFPFTDNTYFTIETPHGKKGFKFDFDPCSKDIYKVFDFNMAEGAAESLEQPASCLIPESLAKIMFPDGSAMGKQLHPKEGLYQVANHDFTITGVYKDFENSQLKNNIYVVMDIPNTNWGQFNCFAYLRLRNAGDAQAVIDNYQRTRTINDFTSSISIRLTPLTDIYFLDDCLYDDRASHGSLSTTIILLSIGILILILAAINFTNFSMALVPFRIKSINTKKVLGSSNAQIERSLIADAVWTSFFSALFSIFIVFCIGKSSLANVATTSIAVSDNWDIVLGTLLLSVIIGIIAGIYPSYYSTSFSPALVLKGSFGLSPKGLLLRKILVSVQFIISLSLITCSLVIQKQNRYLSKGELGFDRNDLYITEINPGLIYEKSKYIEQTVNAIPGVVNMAFAQDKICSRDNYQRWLFKVDTTDVSSTVMLVSWNYPATLGLTAIQGSLPTHCNDTSYLPIVNNKFIEDYHCTINSRIQDDYYFSSKIQAVTDDIRVFSLKKAIDPTVMMVIPDNRGGFAYMYLRLNHSSEQEVILRDVEKLLLELDPTYPYNFESFNDILAQRFDEEAKFEKGIKAFSILAIIISMIGVFGLILFDTQQKRKEIAIRRVLGATDSEVMKMFSRSYVILLSICFVISIPIVIYICSVWLNNFSDKVSLGVLPFIIAFAIIFLITMGTISFQVLRSVRNNPVNSISVD